MSSDPVAGATDGESKTGQQTPEPEPLDPAKPPPDDRYCDLVLTGGVTDGVVYPWAILELARQYRFKNIGGTSVGAMAAALTAAAEYARRRGHLTGFNEVLLKLPRKLGDTINGKPRLFSLFQPAKSTQRLFDLFVSFFSPDPSAFGKGWIRKYGLPVLHAYRQPALIGAAIGLLVGSVSIGRWWYWNFGSGSTLTLTELPTLVFGVLLVAVPWALVFVLVSVVIAVYRDLVHGLVPNGFGLCNGGRVAGTPGNEKALIEWLHQGIQLAALKPLDEPLTFKDLWEAPGGPVERPMPPALPTRKSRSIDLRMITTNLTHGRPYGLPLGDQTSLPLDDETSRLFFKIKDLKPYFPEPVLNHLIRHSKRYSPAGPEDPGQTSNTHKLLELPRGELPVVVAARLSLSFPVLFSAVPIWAIDYEPKRKNRKLRRCWFSDGGICSNFPIHLFDAAIPEWPTFGISLARRSIFRMSRFVWLPKRHYQGRGDSWQRFDDEKSPLDRLVGFIASIVFSAKDWNDKTTMRMPGVRDRVVHIFQEDGEGGLDLKLTAGKIMQLASDFGQPAGNELVKKFIDRAPGNRPSSFWNEHRWVRFNTYLVGLRERIEGITAAAELTGYGKPLTQQISDAIIERPLDGTDAAGARLTPAQADDLEKLLAALKELESKFALAEIPQPYKPLPTPSLRIRPPV